MANPTLTAIWKQARAHLNDVAIAKFTNQVLLPFTQDAVHELEDTLLEHGVNVFKETSAKLDVPANTTAISYTTTPALPSDLVDVTTVEEKVDGAGDDTYVELAKPLRLPRRVQGGTLDEYVWEEQQIKFVGATLPVDILIRYLKGFPVLTDPADGNQEVPFNEGLPFLAYKTSALAAELIDQNHDRAYVLHQQAEMAMRRILNLQARSNQDQPVRRRGWRRSSRRGAGGRGLVVIR